MPAVLILLGLGALFLYMRQEPVKAPATPGKPAGPVKGLPPGPGPGQGPPPVNGGAGPPIDQVPPDVSMDLVIATQELGAMAQTNPDRVREVTWWLAPIAEVQSTHGLQFYIDELTAMSDLVRGDLGTTIERAVPDELAAAADLLAGPSAGGPWPQTAAQLEMLSAIAGAPTLTPEAAALVRDVAENGAAALTLQT